MQFIDEITRIHQRAKQNGFSSLCALVSGKKKKEIETET